MKEKRKITYNLVINYIKKLNIYQYLRGSWKNKNFHLNNKNSFSDFDFIVIDKNINEENIRNNLNKFLTTIIDNKIKISIHKYESLENVNFVDKKILVLGEYIATYKKYILTQEIPKDYFIAKFLLLLLRAHTQESYREVAARCNHPAVTDCLKMKLGYVSALQSTTVPEIMASWGKDPFIHFFIVNYCLSDPTPETEKTVLEMLYAAPSIDEWLRSYLISKMNG